MTNGIFIIVILIVAFMAIATGFRKGITRQIPALLGFSFGAVGARVFSAEFADYFQWTANFSQAPEFIDFTSNLVGGISVYCAIFVVIYLLTFLISRAMAVIRVGMFNRLVGAFFSLVKNLLWLSMAFNLLLCFSPASGLLQYEKSNDGNLIAAVMALTPAIIGCYGAEDFAHFNQLKEAKLISCNIRASKNVIIS